MPKFNKSLRVSAKKEDNKTTGNIEKFKRRWARVNKFQDNELRKISIREKFYQLSSIIRLAMGMRLDFSEDRENRKVRSRWVILKQKCLKSGRI